jgi:hypothetical protein
MLGCTHLAPMGFVIRRQAPSHNCIAERIIECIGHHRFDVDLSAPHSIQMRESIRDGSKNREFAHLKSTLHIIWNLADPAAGKTPN